MIFDVERLIEGLTKESLEKRYAVLRGLEIIGAR
jgi:hypothetical protein